MLWVLLNLLFIFLNDFRSTSCCWIWIAEEGMCSKAKASWEAVIIVDGTEGPGFVLQPLRANVASIKTLHSNRRITTHGTEMLFHTEKRNIRTPQCKAKLWIANSSLLCSLSVCNYVCAQVCVCVYANIWEGFCPLTTYCIPKPCLCRTMCKDSVAL